MPRRCACRPTMNTAMASPFSPVTATRPGISRPRSMSAWSASTCRSRCRSPITPSAAGNARASAISTSTARIRCVSTPRPRRSPRAGRPASRKARNSPSPPWGEGILPLIPGQPQGPSREPRLLSAIDKVVKFLDPLPGLRCSPGRGSMTAIIVHETLIAMMASGPRFSRAPG
ncbi:hypothetical protein CHELA1G11_13104 [Hyphomicrobiales bacterium]|nr:hypothetical protein CHELA1G11_13104 [Hyphomicrobiales bacterium]